MGYHAYGAAAGPLAHPVRRPIRPGWQQRQAHGIANQHADSLIFVEQAAGPVLGVLVEELARKLVDSRHRVSKQPSRRLLRVCGLARGHWSACGAREHDGSASLERSGGQAC